MNGIAPTCNAIYPIQNAHHFVVQCLVVVISLVLIGFVWIIFPYSSALFHCHWDSYMISLASVTQPWSTWVKMTRRMVAHWKQKITSLITLSSLIAPLVVIMSMLSIWWCFVFNVGIYWTSTGWWCHAIETLSALLALYERNPPVTCGCPSQMASNMGFDVSINKLQTVKLLVIWNTIAPMWSHCNVYIILQPCTEIGVPCFHLDSLQPCQIWWSDQYDSFSVPHPVVQWVHWCHEMDEFCCLIWNFKVGVPE